MVSVVSLNVDVMLTISAIAVEMAVPQVAGSVFVQLLNTILYGTVPTFNRNIPSVVGSCKEVHTLEVGVPVNPVRCSKFSLLISVIPVGIIVSLVENLYMFCIL